MKGYFFISFLVASVFYSARAQTTQDSLNVIERQRIELRDQQARLKAKQDSLVKERLRIEQQQQQQQQQPNPPSQPVYTYYQTGQPSSKREVKNIIGLAPLHMFITGVEVFYERALSKHSSLQWNVGYHYMDNFPETDGNGNVSTYGNNTTRLGSAFYPIKTG